jgi:trimeric autotransporter adhesin
MRAIKLLGSVSAGIVLVSASALPAAAQTVFGTGTPANCVQNAPNTDLACGSGSVASPGTGTTAVGINAKANGDAATAFGAGATATSISATSFGQGAAASATGAIAIGQGASATGSSAIGIGFAGRGLAARAIGIGEVATANGSDSTAIGANTSAGFTLSTALGANAQATAANQMMFGTATNILAAPGLVSAASKAAQKGKVLMVTVDANGNLATAAVPACRCPPPVVVRPTKARKR